jgi:hypothetical protein
MVLQRLPTVKVRILFANSGAAFLHSCCISSHSLLQNGHTSIASASPESSEQSVIASGVSLSVSVGTGLACLIFHHHEVLRVYVDFSLIICLIFTHHRKTLNSHSVFSWKQQP